MALSPVWPTSQSPPLLVSPCSWCPSAVTNTKASQPFLWPTARKDWRGSQAYLFVPLAVHLSEETGQRGSPNRRGSQICQDRNPMSLPVCSLVLSTPVVLLDQLVDKTVKQAGREPWDENGVDNPQMQDFRAAISPC